METHWHDRDNRISIPSHEPDLPRWAWALVANIRREGFPDAGPLNNRGGTKHFAPGARVYVLPVRWDGWWERGPVIGKLKGSNRYVRKVMSWDWLENFRCKRVYSPAVISWMMGARSEIKNCGCPYDHGIEIDGWSTVDAYKTGNGDFDRAEIEEIVELYHQGMLEKCQARRKAWKEENLAWLRARGKLP